MSVPTLPIHIATSTTGESLASLRAQVVGLGTAVSALNAQFGATGFKDPLAGLRTQMAQDIAEIKTLLGTQLKEAVAAGAAAVKAGNAQVLAAIKQTTEQTKTVIQASQAELVTASKASKAISLVNVSPEADAAKIKSAAAAVEVAMRTAAAESRAFSTLSSGNVANKRNLPVENRSALDQIVAQKVMYAELFDQIKAQEVLQAKAYAADLAGYRAMLALKVAAQDKALVDDLAGYRAMLALKTAAQNKAEADDLVGYRAMLALKVAAQNRAEADDLSGYRAMLALKTAAQNKAEADDLAGYRTMLALKVAAQNKALAGDLDGYRAMLALKAAAQNKALADDLAGYKVMLALKHSAEAKQLLPARAPVLPAAPAGGSPFRAMTLDMNDAHAAARGLAGGFGQLWLTYGSVLPLVAGAALATSFVKSLQTGAKFAESLFVIAELASNTGEQVKSLSNAALDLGRTSQYGPVEVAKGMEILALAGLKASEVLVAIKPTLNFASAGGVGLEKAAETLVAVGTAYGFTASQFEVVGDIIAKSAADSMASVESLSEAFKASSVVGQQYGVTLQDMAQNLMFLAQIGIKGSAAGTSVRNMYAELAKGSGKVADALAKMGVEAQDGNGKMRPLMATMQDMVLATANLTGKGANTFFQTISNERGGKDLAAIYAGVYKVINENEAKRLASSAEGTKSVYETVDALEAQGRKVEANALKVDTLKKGFAAMNEQQAASAANTAGFAFFADLERQLTPLTQYKGLLASLQTDFVQAFTGAEASIDGSHKAINGAQDALYLLGVQLKGIADSEGFRQAIASMVSGLASFLSTVVNLGQWLSEHGRLLSSLALFYVAYRAAVAAAAIQTAVFAATQTALAAVMAGTLASSLTGSMVALYATAQAYAAARGAALAFQLTVVTFGVAAVAAGGYALYLAAKYLFIAESAEEAADRTRTADLANLQESTKANAARIEQTLEAVQADNDKFARLEELRAQGITGEIATVKVAGEAAMARIGFNEAESESLAKRTLEQRQANLAVAQSAVDGVTKYARFVPYVGAPLVAAAAVAQGVLIKQGKDAMADYEASLGKIRLGAATSLNQTAAAFDKRVSNSKIEKDRADAAALAAGKRFTGGEDFASGKDKDKGAGAERVARASYSRQLTATNEYFRDHKKTLDEGYKQEQDALKGAISARELTETQGYVKSLSSTVAYEKAQSTLIEQTYTERKAKLASVAGTFVAGTKGYSEALAQQTEEEKKAANQYKESTDQLAQLVAARKAAASVLLAKSLSDDSEAFKKANSDLEIYNKGLALKAAADREAAGLSAEARAGFEARADYLAKFAKEEEALTVILVAQTAAAQTLGVALMDAQLAGQTEALPELRDRFDKVTSAVARSTEKLNAYSAALADGGNKAALDATNKELIKQFDDTNVKIKDGIADAIFNGSKTGAQGLKDQLRKAIIDFSKQKFRILIDAVLNPVSSAITGFLNPAAGAAASAFGGGGGLSALSSLSNLSGIGTSIATTVGSTLANILPTSIASGLGLSSSALVASNIALAGGGASATAAATAAAAAGNAGLVSGIGSAIAAIPVWGQIAFAVVAVASLLGGKKDSRYGSQYEYVAGSDTRIVGGPNKGVDYGNQMQAQDVVIGTINSLLKRVGSSQQVGNFASGFESSEKGKGFSYAGGTFANGTTFGQGATGRGFENNRGSKTPDQAMAEYRDELMQATLQALQSASDLPKIIADKLKGVDIDALSGEALKNFSLSIDKMIAEVESFQVAVGLLPFKELQGLSFDAAAAMLAAGGGLEKLSASLGTYYENFYSEEEKRAQTISGIARALNAGGVQISEDTVRAMSGAEDGRAQFRALVESYGAATEANAPMLTALYATAAAFAGITPAVELAVAAVETISDTLKSLRKESESLAVSLMRAQGDTKGADKAQYGIDTAGLSEAERAVFDYNASIRSQIEVLNAAKAIASQRSGLEIQVMQLQGDAAGALAAQRKIELSAMDDSLRPIQELIYGLQDLATAAEKAKAIASQRGQLEISIMQLQGNAAGALAAQRQIELAAMDETLRPLQQIIYGLQDMQAAAARYAAEVEKEKAAAAARLSGVTATASDAFSGLQKAVEAQKAEELASYNAAKAAAEAIFNAQVSSAQAAADSVKKSLSTIGESLGKLRSLSSSLKSALDGLRISGSDASYRKDAQAQITAALATARNGGGFPLEGQLNSALATISKPSEELFTSFEDYARDFYKTANDISQLSALTDAQITADEITQGILQAQSEKQEEQIGLLKNGFADQVSTLDDILSNAQSQLDMANGINTSVLSVSAALVAFNQSIIALTTERAKQDLPTSRGQEYTKADIIGEVRAMVNSGSSVSSIYDAAAEKYGVGATQITNATTGQGMVGFDAATGTKTKDYSQTEISDGISYYMGLGSSISDIYGIGSNLGISPADIARAGKAASIPGFARGGTFGGGLRMVGENGPELEVTGPSRIFSADQTSSMMRGGGGANMARLESLVENLTAEVQGLRSEAAATAGHTAKTARMLTRAIPEGDAMQVRTVT